jgi:UPF0755 protein
MSRRAPVARPEPPSPRSPPDMPDSSSDDPFADLFGQLPDSRTRTLRGSGDDADPAAAVPPISAPIPLPPTPVTGSRPSAPMRPAVSPSRPRGRRAADRRAAHRAQRSAVAAPMPAAAVPAPAQAAAAPPAPGRPKQTPGPPPSRSPSGGRMSRGSSRMPQPHRPCRTAATGGAPRANPQRRRPSIPRRRRPREPLRRRRPAVIT